MKLIYIDPPYNTGKDFVYRDDYVDGIKNYLQITGQVDDNGQKISTNTESSGRFHTHWLNMMYPRLKLARDLLSQDGVLFISLDDGEIDNLRKLCSEIFGEENFITTVIWQKKYAPSNDAKWLSDNHDYIVLVARHKEAWRPNLLPRTDEANARYENPDNDHRGVWKSSGLDVKTYAPEYDYVIQTPSGRAVHPPPGACWRVSKTRFYEMVADNRIWFGKSGNNVPSIKRFLSEVKDGMTPVTIWPHKEVGHNQEATQEVRRLGVLGCDSPKPLRLLERVIQIGSDKDSIVLDFFAGSGTTGHAVMNQNAADGGRRRYIAVQLPEQLDSKASNQLIAAEFLESIGKPPNLAELTKERLRRAAKAIESTNPDYEGDLGFRTFKLDSSNIKTWEPDRDDLEQSLLDYVDHIKEDRSEQDILYELLLKRGLDLCAPIETRNFAVRRVNAVANGALLLCLAEQIGAGDVEELAGGHCRLARRVEEHRRYHGDIPRQRLCRRRCQDQLHRDLATARHQERAEHLMKLKFESDLEYQQTAITAVCDLFRGQEVCRNEFTVAHGLEEKGLPGLVQNELGIGNLLTLPDDVILANLQEVQLRNGLLPAPSLESHDFTVDMETGTGKTYVYLRTIFELNQRYGFTKFAIVVPSVAIKEGVNKSLEMMGDHLRNLYSGVPFEHFIYDSTKLGQVRNFATSPQIQIMVITVGAINKQDINTIYQENEKTGGERPIDLVKATNPIVIVDEPQSVDGGLQGRGTRSPGADEFPLHVALLSNPRR